MARRGGARDYHLKARYGLTSQDIEAMIAGQGGLCAICREAPAKHLDHDHETGRARGVLCVPCNNGLGLFRDDSARLSRAAEYLEAAR